MKIEVKVIPDGDYGPCYCVHIDGKPEGALCRVGNKTQEQATEWLLKVIVEDQQNKIATLQKELGNFFKLRNAMREMIGLKL